MSLVGAQPLMCAKWSDGRLSMSLLASMSVVVVNGIIYMNTLAMSRGFLWLAPYPCGAPEAAVVAENASAAVSHIEKKKRRHTSSSGGQIQVVSRVIL